MGLVGWRAGPTAAGPKAKCGNFPAVLAGFSFPENLPNGFLLARSLSWRVFLSPKISLAGFFLPANFPVGFFLHGLRHCLACGRRLRHGTSGILAISQASR
jgi:hypothetical protein